MKPEMKQDKLSTLLETKFMNVYDYPFGDHGHYYTASRRKTDDLVMLKSDEAYKGMVADAVTCAVIVKLPGQEPKLLMNYEFRYALGRFLMAPPAGLIDPEDRESDEPLIETAKREIKEETGIDVKDSDRVYVVNPLLFSSPGMTDESNAIVCAVVDLTSMEILNHDGSVGSEVFNGFEMLSLEEARACLRRGTDKNGLYYSVYTWICLMYFASEAWR